MPDMNNESELRRDNAELHKRVTDLENAISERKQIEEELRTSERQYFTIFNNANDLIHIVSPAGKILAVNKKWLTTLEYSQEEAKGLQVTDILLDDEIPQTSGQFKKVAEGESVSIGTVFISRSGKKIDVEGNGKGIFIDGKFVSAVGIFRDISERRKAVNALLEANKIINRSPAVAFLWSMEKDWPVEFVSDNVQILTGYSSQEFIERKISYRDIIYSDDLERVTEEVTKFGKIEGLKTYAHKPYRITTKNGEIKWVNDKTYIRRDSRGITTHHEGVVSDITEEMKLEGQLRQAQKMESVGRLAGSVAHDFNNMLSVILGHTEMALGKTTPSQPIHAHLTEIIKAAERSVNLTKQLLAFARKQTIAPRVLDLNKTVVGMIEMLRRLIGEDIHLTFLPGKDL
ncbi:MAG: PAS domain S-box protein, partial [Candidatus Aegiribacteria sp.]|nr:PAS domain S-box protein [Candidatus Aegiribacteria sp.]